MNKSICTLTLGILYGNRFVVVSSTKSLHGKQQKRFLEVERTVISLEAEEEVIQRCVGGHLTLINTSYHLLSDFL